MTLAKLQIVSRHLDRAALERYGHLLLLMPAAEKLPADLPARVELQAVLARRDMKAGELAKTPLAVDLGRGQRCVFAMVDAQKSRFDCLTHLRKAVQGLLDEKPARVALSIHGADPEAALALARDAVYVTLVNGATLPKSKRKAETKLEEVSLLGGFRAADFDAVRSLARANTLARQLTALPPNALTPGHYRERVRALARRQGWRIEEYGFKRLRKMGAGAFCAVAQGSHDQDAAIMHLSYRPKGAKQRVAIVGKGICFDTGGHNLKPAKHMAGMHEDMNGSAVALALLLAVQELRLPLAVDAWLAIAQNHLSPRAYKQNDIVTALDGSSIEIVHTDAEGRLVLADTLTLAVREKPNLLLDFATLTGSMTAALGTRYAGVFASSNALAELAVAAGRSSGERVCVFPMDEDYEAGLESKVADIKQCTLEGDADHILAARFLQRFVGAAPWLHIDLSAANCGGGLGAVASDITGFGVAWGATLLARLTAP